MRGANVPAFKFPDFSYSVSLNNRECFSPYLVSPDAPNISTGACNPDRKAL
jgi:hypothetical protein